MSAEGDAGISLVGAYVAGPIIQWYQDGLEPHVDPPVESTVAGEGAVDYTITTEVGQTSAEVSGVVGEEEFVADEVVTEIAADSFMDIIATVASDAALVASNPVG